MKAIHVITGQTATGKTSYAIDVAQKIDGELINADSRQIYKKLDIVTGKDLDLTDRLFHCEKILTNFDIGYYNLKTENRNLTPKIWLYDVVDPSYNFSAHDYKICALKVIEHIIQSGKTPIIVGGSYLYIKNLLYDTIDINVPPDEKLRTELSELSISELHKKLISYNSNVLDHMNESDRKNPHRLIRKIEIEKSIESQDVKKSPIPIADQYNIDLVGLRHDSNEELASIIRKRVDERIKNGALEEVRHLLKMGFSEKTPGLNAIGYSQIISFLQKRISHDKMVEEWTTKEAQYAKRQYTFMKQNNDITWTEL